MKIGWRNALGIALSAVLLWWTLHGIPLGRVVEHMRAANLPLLLLSVTLATLCFPLRARRWRTILDPVALHLPVSMLWRATAIGMMVNNVIPARAGELARAYALSRETERVSFSAAFASLAVDRLFDALILLVMMLIGMMGVGFPSGRVIGGHPLSSYIILAGAFACTLLGVLYLIVFFPRRLIALFELFARKVAPRIEDRGRGLLLSFAEGLGVLRSPRRFLAVLLWTIVHWLVNALAFWVGFLALGIDTPFGSALFLQGLIGFGVAVPSAPGFFGVFEAIAQVGLGFYGVSASLAVSWAIAYHGLSFIPITVIGIYYFARLGMHFTDLQRAKTDGADAAAMPAARQAAD